MTQDQPDAQPPSQSTVPVAVLEYVGSQVTQLARLCNEFIQYQQGINEDLTKRVESLEQRMKTRDKRSR